MSAADKDADKELARVGVRILDKEYMVACPYEQRSALLDSAQYLDGKMREVRDSGKVVGLDRIAVIATLNLANDHVLSGLSGRIAAVIDGAVARSQQLDL